MQKKTREIQFSIQNEVRTLMITNPPIGVLVLMMTVMMTAFTNAANLIITSNDGKRMFDIGTKKG